jgi:hypothetical protein
MTPLTAEKIAELEGLPAMWRDAAELLHSGPVSGAFDTCADELERLIAPFLSLAKRVAGGGEWRLLKDGETIEANDEVLADNTNDWLPLVGWEIGMMYRIKVFVPVRRRVALVEIVGGEEGNG